MSSAQTKLSITNNYVLGTNFFCLDAVDRRGRKVKQSSSEDLRKFYDLDGKGDLTIVATR